MMVMVLVMVMKMMVMLPMVMDGMPDGKGATMERLGLDPAGASATLFGTVPRIFVGATTMRAGSVPVNTLGRAFCKRLWLDTGPVGSTTTHAGSVTVLGLVLIIILAGATATQNGMVLKQK